MVSFALAAVVALPIMACGADPQEVGDLEEDQVLSVEEALAPGCWSFDKGAIGGGIRYLHFKDYPWDGPQRIHAVRIHNGHDRIKGYAVSHPVSSFMTTAEFAHRQTGMAVAINGDFRNNNDLTWGLWKSQDRVWHEDDGNPFIAYGKRGDDLDHPERVAVYWYPKRPSGMENHATPGTMAVSGFPELVRDGALTVPSTCPHKADLCSGNHPRTASGMSDNGLYTYYVVVEGRLPGASGMTARSLAELMKKKVCADYAINHDGGGSSTMWIRGRGVVNRCSDATGCRHLVNHQGVRRD